MSGAGTIAILKRTPWRRMAGAATVGLALAVFAAVVLTSGRGVQVSTAPELSSTVTAGAVPPPTLTPQPVVTPTGRGNNSAATADLRLAVLAGQAAGEIRPQCAESLLSRISDLQRRIDRGDDDNARQRIEQIRDEIDDRAEGGEVTGARAAGLRQALANLTF